MGPGIHYSVAMEGIMSGQQGKGGPEVPTREQKHRGRDRMEFQKGRSPVSRVKVQVRIAPALRIT